MRSPLLFILAVAAASCAQESVPESGDALVEKSARAAAGAPEFDAIIDNAVAEGFAGQLVIMRGGRVIYDRAAGSADLAGNVPVTPETLFQISSMVKFFTAVMTLKAVEEGRLNLDDSAEKLFSGTALASRDFTLRDILDHHTGMRSTYAAEKQFDGEKAIEAIAAANKVNPKDGAFHYSNDAYDALGAALERIYGKPYEEIFREKIAAPAGLSHFAFWGDAVWDDPHLRAQPLTPTPAELKSRNYGMIGSAGVLIAAADLVQLRKALNDGKIIGPEMLAELNEPRGKISIGDVLYGAFLVETPMGSAMSARGAEDWGDNSYLNFYPECDAIIAVATSRGPAESTGKPLFRNQIIKAVEEKLAPECSARK
ncbi:MAG: serine hydrolase domain-containing protein [Parvularculaceae bacterium]